ncbi:MAG: dipeptidase PepE [Flavobacteriaceae bacterium]|jgi:dipeptidase E|nr:dipeptidase PepE [Flavobacteriaceae bacterium]MBT3919792.1 dipeptidase PepE [Flavobacteriaceae bacterium]MBT6705358.1 dipeptidase PepE [Flavobacteriaceae bacterium]MBT7242517.1 dipeptidase PepE [Flavobacteriaceae bacterium]|tara:strand:- start:744 stop:1448 length:705 start_codon:yes stop_codon:yes gene_type:complete
MKNLIVASTSTIHGGTYLSYLFPEIAQLFSETEEVLFIPYARPSGISHNKYTEIAQEAFSKIGKKVIGIHSLENPVEAVNNAKGIFIGGGNTFVLVSELYRKNTLEVLRKVIFDGLPYLGTSAGSNICGITMNTTNDMPIIYPPSFKTLGIIPFNINPHYLDPDPSSKHMGETRETRINEFHTQSTIPVIGIREGSWLQVKNDTILLKGTHSARIFEQNKKPYEIETETILKFY